MLHTIFNRTLLSEEDHLFQVETFKWLLSNFDSDHFYKDSQLVLPTKDYFSFTEGDLQKRAESIFEQVKKYAGMERWECKLQAQEEDLDPYVGETLLIQGAPSEANGTFSYTPESGVVITYAPKLINRPAQLVATLAHELAHYLTGFDEKKPPPGGWDNWEFATDIAAVFMGFGIFMANSVFSFNQYTNSGSQGWSSSRSGYLSESEMAFSLALFTELKCIDPKITLKYLESTPKALYKKSIKEIRKSEIIKEIKGGANA